MIPQTSWANKRSPYTGTVPMKEVPIPKIVQPRKGHTKYDEEFHKLMTFKTAIEMHEDNFPSIQRALKRYVKFRDLGSKVCIRQQLNPMTRHITVWLEKKQ